MFGDRQNFYCIFANLFFHYFPVILNQAFLTCKTHEAQRHNKPLDKLKQENMGDKRRQIRLTESVSCAG